MAWYRDRPYVPAAARQERAAREVAKRRKKGLDVQPVTIDGQTIARSFWGNAWCDHLEGYSDYANRLPRGRTYVRNGSVLHLGVAGGRVDALVQGSRLYTVAVHVAPLAPARWKAVVAACTGEVDSLVELLTGKLSDGVMRVVTDRDTGLFPAPSHIRMECSCPDWATMCKHVAAVLYGVGARLDERPELLFTLRKVDHLELLTAGPAARGPARRTDAPTIAAEDLGSVFGIELDEGPARGARTPAVRPARVRAPKAAGGAPRARPRADGGANAAAETSPAAIVRQVVRLLRKNEQGLSAAEIRARLGLDARALARALTSAMADRKVWMTGAGRTTAYLAD